MSHETGAHGILPPDMLAWLGQAPKGDVETLIRVIEETAALRSEGTHASGRRLEQHLEARGLEFGVLPEGALEWLGAVSAEDLARLERVAEQALAMKTIGE
jgi:hypothetical protein